MPEVSLYCKCLGIMTSRDLLKIVALEPEILIPYYKLSIDYYKHAVRF